MQFAERNRISLIKSTREFERCNPIRSDTRPEVLPTKTRATIKTKSSQMNVDILNRIAIHFLPILPNIAISIFVGQEVHHALGTCSERPARSGTASN